jgi:hypothetical protein
MSYVFMSQQDKRKARFFGHLAADGTLYENQDFINLGISQIRKEIDRMSDGIF